MLSKKTDLYEMIYQVVRLVPQGKVTTYGAIAQYLGSVKSSRIVGWAMNTSHSQTDYVPAHRVVNRMGFLTGKMHFSHPSKMQELLEEEGHIIVDDQVIDFGTKFWNPNKELVL